ncbi:hypothetical protein Q5752_006563 [Cryptotrichosporon argae]
MEQSSDQADHGAGGTSTSQQPGSNVRHRQVTSMTFFMPFPNQQAGSEPAADGTAPPRPNGISWTIQVVAEGEGEGEGAGGGSDGGSDPSNAAAPSPPVFLLDPRMFPGGVPPFFQFMGQAQAPGRPDPAKAAELLKSLPTVARALMRRLDKIEAAESDDGASGWRCAVCLDGAEGGGEGDDTGVKALPCHHLFHATCLEPWFSTKHTCPTCRLDLDPMHTLEPPRRVFSRPGPTGTARAQPHPYQRPSRPSSPSSRPSSRPQTPGPPVGNAESAEPSVSGLTSSSDSLSVPAVDTSTTAETLRPPQRILSPLPLRASPQPLDFAALAAHAFASSPRPELAAAPSPAPGTDASSSLAPQPAPSPLPLGTASIVSTEPSATRPAAPSAANLFAASMNANPSFTHYSLPRAVRSVQVTMRPARLNVRPSPPPAGPSGPSDGLQDGHAADVAPVDVALPSRRPDASSTIPQFVSDGPAFAQQPDAATGRPALLTLPLPAAPDEAPLDQATIPPAPTPTLPPMTVPGESGDTSAPPPRPQHHPRHPPQRAHRLPFPFPFLLPPGLPLGGPRGGRLASGPSETAGADAADAPAAEDAQRPPRSRPQSPRATLPEPKETLEAWTIQRERSLGWRCDAVECGHADAAAAAEAQGADAEAAPHAGGSGSAALGEGARDAFLRVEGADGPVCQHRWHRACLESAGRSAGHWRGDADRVWVRCDRCRRDGWVGL